jgi:glucose/arabinose dehydrogenase
MHWNPLRIPHLPRHARRPPRHRPRLELLEDRLAPATLPTHFTESLIATGLSNPTAMEFAPDGRLFVCEQGGSLRVIQNDTLLPTPFVTLPVSSAGERGLLGVTFDPSFATNQYVYVYYTATTPTVHNRISRFTANGNVAVPGSEFVVMDLEKTWALPTTTAARSTSDRTASCTPRSARTQCRLTPRRWPTVWARCCGSTRTAPSPWTIPSMTWRPA